MLSRLSFRRAVLPSLPPLSAVFAVFAVAAASLLLAPAPLRAQNLPDSPHGSPPAVSVERQGIPEPPADHEPGDRKLPLESVAPYSAWKHHVAEKPEQAIVQVRYAESPTAPGGTATGLVIRCDGFVLVPRAVRDLAKNGGRVEVVYPEVDRAEIGGTGDSTDSTGGNGSTGKQPPPVTAAARFHIGTHTSVPYALIKTSGQHARSLPLLESRNVAPGQPVRLLWFASGSGGAANGVTALRGVIGPATETRDTFSVSPVDGSGEAVPSGAVVVDEASGAAVGMVTQGGTSPAFITLASFRIIAGEVGVAPDRAAVRLGDRQGTLPKNAAAMVWVPGGPVALDGPAAKESSLAYGTTVACTPGFWMAVQPVTNGEYRTWLKGKGLPLPYGWSDQDLLAPARRPDIPACGMFPDEAISYASSQQSRLPTEVEWRRAAYTRDTAWVEEQNANWGTASRELIAIFREIFRHFQTAQRFAMLNARERFEIQRNLRRPNAVNTPNNANTRVNVLVPSTPELDDATARLDSYVTDFLSRQDIWGQVHQIDAFRQDVSVFGVRNVLINAPELVLSRLHHTTLAAKRFPAAADPDLQQYKASVNTQGTGATPESEEALRRLLWNSLKIITWRGGSASVTWAGSGMAVYTTPEGSSSEGLLTHAQGSLLNQARAGFRCAR